MGNQNSTEALNPQHDMAQEPKVSTVYQSTKPGIERITILYGEMKFAFFLKKLKQKTILDTFDLELNSKYKELSFEGENDGVQYLLKDVLEDPEFSQGYIIAAEMVVKINRDVNPQIQFIVEQALESINVREDNNRVEMGQCFLSIFKKADDAIVVFESDIPLGENDTEPVYLKGFDPNNLKNPDKPLKMQKKDFELFQCPKSLLKLANSITSFLIPRLLDLLQKNEKLILIGTNHMGVVAHLVHLFYRQENLTSSGTGQLFSVAVNCPIVIEKGPSFTHVSILLKQYFIDVTTPEKPMVSGYSPLGSTVLICPDKSYSEYFSDKPSLSRRRWFHQTFQIIVPDISKELETPEKVHGFRARHKSLNKKSFLKDSLFKFEIKRVDISLKKDIIVVGIRGIWLDNIFMKLKYSLFEATKQDVEPVKNPNLSLPTGIVFKIESKVSSKELSTSQKTLMDYIQGLTFELDLTQHSFPSSKEIGFVTFASSSIPEPNLRA
jgi:hypothetical protein